MAGSPLQKSETELQIDIFRALSEPLRVQIISLFDQEGRCACTDLEKALPVTKSTISYHIRILAQAGLLDVTKQGRYYHYSLRKDVFEHFLPGFLDRLDAEREPTPA